uniref:hypothetical protein n=1 Tax=Staphylococcus hominis TaxID=1290 RepID=UPI001642DFF4
MKEDDMKNGEVKGGYNLEIGRNCELVLCYNVYENGSDRRRMIGFLNLIEER